PTAIHAACGKIDRKFSKRACYRNNYFLRTYWTGHRPCCNESLEEIRCRLYHIGMDCIYPGYPGLLRCPFSDRRHCRISVRNGIGIPVRRYLSCRSVTTASTARKNEFKRPEQVIFRAGRAHERVARDVKDAPVSGESFTSKVIPYPTSGPDKACRTAPPAETFT